MQPFSRLLLGLILLHSFTLQAQNLTIQGFVKDQKDQSPLAGVHVLTNTGDGAVTDMDGRFSLQVAALPDSLECRYIGYVRTTVPVTPTNFNQLQILLNPDEGLLNTVVVTGSRFEKNLGTETVSIEVIKPGIIEHSNNVSLENAIQKVPGVNVIDGQANIRGGTGFSYGAGSRVLLLMDGLPMLSADAASSFWNVIPIENIGQIEVIKGAASALYGSSALNGIINVRTAYAESEPVTKVSYFSGLFGAPSDTNQQWWDTETPYFTGISMSHKQKFNRLDLVAGGYLYAQNSYLQGDYDRWGRVNLQTRYRFSERLSAGVNVLAHLNRSVSFFYWNNIDSGLYVPAEGTLTYNKGLRYSVDPFVNFTDQGGNKHKWMGRLYTTDNSTRSDQSVQADLNYGEYQFQRELTSWQLVITTGAVASASLVTAELYGDSTYKAFNQAGYLQLDKAWGSWNLNAGMRYERNELDTIVEARPVWRLGVSYAAAPFTFLRASWGQGYRFPSIAEKFVNTSVGILYIFPNPALESETGWTAEVGIKQGLRISNWQAFADVSVFTSRYFNMMEFTFGNYPETGWPLPGFKSLNIGNTQINGAEFSLTGNGKLGKLPLTILAGYTYINPTFQDFDSITNLNSTSDENVLKYRFRHVVKLDAESTFSHFRPGIEINYNSFMEAIDQAFYALIPGLEDYRMENNTGEAIVNVRFAWLANENTEIAFICNNLLNNEYMLRPAFPDPVRHYTLKLTCNW